VLLGQESYDTYAMMPGKKWMGAAVCSAVSCYSGAAAMAQCWRALAAVL
jgi:hypothetical protein